jgi:hypothetical protein
MLARPRRSNIKASIPLTGGLNVFEPTETSWVEIIVPQSEDEGYVPGALEKACPRYVRTLAATNGKIQFSDQDAQRL